VLNEVTQQHIIQQHLNKREIQKVHSLIQKDIMNAFDILLAFNSYSYYKKAELPQR